MSTLTENPHQSIPQAAQAGQEPVQQNLPVNSDQDLRYAFNELSKEVKSKIKETLDDIKDTKALVAFGFFIILLMFGIFLIQSFYSWKDSNDSVDEKVNQMESQLLLLQAGKK